MITYLRVEQANGHPGNFAVMEICTVLEPVMGILIVCSPTIWLVISRTTIKEWVDRLLRNTKSIFQTHHLDEPVEPEVSKLIRSPTPFLQIKPELNGDSNRYELHGEDYRYELEWSGRIELGNERRSGIRQRRWSIV